MEIELGAMKPLIGVGNGRSLQSLDKSQKSEGSGSHSRY